MSADHYYKDKCLLLNASYEPLGVQHVFHSFTLIYKGKAQLIEKKDEPLKGATKEYPKPDVIRLKEYVNVPRTSVKFNRRNIYRRDDYTCQYCGKEFDFGDLTYDHVMPQSRGGETTWDNIVTCCFDCNVNKKGDRTPEEAGLRLLNEPKEPRWTPHEKMNITNPPKQWNPYLWS